MDPAKFENISPHVYLFAELPVLSESAGVYRPNRGFLVEATNHSEGQNYIEVGHNSIGYFHPSSLADRVWFRYPSSPIT